MGFASDRAREDRYEGYQEGYADGYAAGLREAARSTIPSVQYSKMVQKKTKRKQSGKAKLLTSMTAPVWKKYKKGSGKKTYVQVRAQVSRSQAYKRKANKL